MTRRDLLLFGKKHLMKFAGSGIGLGAVMVLQEKASAAKENLGDHEQRIRELESYTTTHTVEIQNLRQWMKSRRNNGT